MPRPAKPQAKNLSTLTVLSCPGSERASASSPIRLLRTICRSLACADLINFQPYTFVKIRDPQNRECAAATTQHTAGVSHPCEPAPAAEDTSVTRRSKTTRRPRARDACSVRSSPSTRSAAGLPLRLQGASQARRAEPASIAEDAWSPVLSLARWRIRSALVEGLNLTLRQVPCWIYGG
jgi:hypothetical protein